MYKEYTMKLFSSILIVSIFIFSAAMAQNGNLNIDLQKIQDSNNWDFNLQYQFTNPITIGVFIELPDKFIVTPISIKVNDQDLWLKNTDEISENDFVVHWEYLENGLILRFSDNLIQSGNQFSLNGLSSTSNNLDDDTVISIKQMVDNDQIGENVIASNNINIIR